MKFFENFKPYEIIDSSIGKLAIFDINLNEKTKIDNELDNNLQDSNGKEYISALVKYACHKENVLDKYQSKPLERTLSDDDIKKLNDLDFELIAKVYIENNEYLNKESIEKTTKGENGIDVTSTKYGDIILPKKDTENYQEYLLRLEIEYNKKINESFKKSFGNLSNFSKGIQESLRNTISLGEQLNKSLNMAPSYRMPKVEPVIPTSDFDHDILFKQKAKNKNKPFKALAERLDQLVEINSDSTKFMLEANKLQTKIAEEIKESSNSSTRLSEINIQIAVVVLIVGILSFAFSIYTVQNSNSSNNANIERAINELKSINQTIKTDNESYEQVLKRLNTLENQFDSVSRRNTEIEKELSKLKFNK